MIDFAALVSPATVAAGVSVRSKKAALGRLGALVAAAAGIDAKAATDRLAAREAIGSTGFGGGVAIPHARVEGLARPVGGLVCFAPAVEFGAVDAMPVDLAFVLLSPADAGSAHLKALAGISRRLRDVDFVAKLRGAGSSDALYALLTDG